MEKVERSIRTWIATQDDRQVKETVSEIAGGQATLVSVVKALGEYLTSEEDHLRTKGVEFLSDVLKDCHSDSFSRQTVRVLVTFYCGKLEDTETIVPALKGLVTLASLPQFTSNDAIDVVQAIFTHVKMKALTVHPRFSVFSIIDSLMDRHRDALKTLGSEFLVGYINLAEGEKDPRNLLLAFAIDRVILIEFEVSSHIEALFDITFCYFPITFRPPPDDPYGISPEKLKDALLGCLDANPSFGPLAIDLFIEKLTAGSPATKRDTLKALNTCLPVYGTAIAQKNARKLWNSLKVEIFQPTDPATEAAALLTSQVLVKTIYADDDKDALSSNEDIQGLASDACEECLRILKEPEKSQAKPAIKVMCAFMSTTPLVSRYTLSQAAPHLLSLFHNPDETSNRAPILSLLAELVEAARNSTIAIRTVNIPLAPYKDETLGVFTVGLKASPSRLPALDGLKSMVKTNQLLADEELGFIVHNVNEVLQDEDSDETSDALIDLLSSISAFAPRHVTETTLPILFSALPDESPSRDSGLERAKYWHTLSLLAKLCTQQSLFETLVIRLSTKLDLICNPRLGSQIDIEPNAAYAHSILLTLASVLSVKVADRHPDIPKYLDRLVLPLYHLFVSTTLSTSEQDIVGTDRRVLVVAGQIISYVTQTLPVQKQQPFAQSLFSLYLTGDTSLISSGSRKLSAEKNFCPLEFNSSSSQKNLMVLLSSAVVQFHTEISLSDNLEDFLGKLLTWSVHETENILQRESAWHIVASILNKKAADLPNFISSTVPSFWDSEVANASASLEHRQHGISAWVWISKALLVRGDHTVSMELTNRLFELFSDSSINWDAASAVGRIAASNTVLTKQNYAVVKLLHAQKFANTILPRLIYGAQSSPLPHEQTAYLVALTSIIKSIPKTIYAHEMPTLMPLLLRGLDLPHNEIKANVIGTLLATTAPATAATNTTDSNKQEENSLVSEHATSLVSIMLKNSMAANMPSFRVRTAALRFLGVLPSVVRYDILHPQKNIVLRELAKCLDDPKRSVRKEAVDTRTKWFQYTG